LVLGGISVNIKAETTGLTPLHRASELSYVHIVSQLIDYGADVNITDSEGKTVLHYADYRNLELLTALHQYGCKINASSQKGVTPLHLACRKCIPKVVSFLLFNGADTNTTDENGWSPLFEAVKAGHLEITKELVKRGARFQYGVDKQGTSILSIAAQYGRNNIISYFLQMSPKPDLNNRDFKGRTPLHYAVSENHADTVKILLSFGGQSHARDTEGKTPIDYAQTLGHKESYLALTSPEDLYKKSLLHNCKLS